MGNLELPDHKIFLTFQLNDKNQEIDLIKCHEHISGRRQNINDIIMNGERKYYNKNLICKEDEQLNFSPSITTIKEDGSTEIINLSKITNPVLEIRSLNNSLLFYDKNVGIQIIKIMKIYKNGYKINPYVSGEKLVCGSNWDIVFDENGDINPQYKEKFPFPS